MVRILLLQARQPGDPVRAEEVRAFASKLAVPEERIVPHQLTQGPPSWSTVRAHDALMIGGSGDFYVSQGNLPRFDALLALMRAVVERAHPTFASCFGFLCLVRALGGEIVRDEERMEVGTVELQLTPEGRRDELLGGLPARFCAQLGHKERVARMPAGVVHLASSETCSYEALRVPGAPIWATQFHPEMDGAENRARFERYAASYGGADPEGLERVLSGFTESSPEVSRLLPRFLDLVFERVDDP